MNWLFNSGTSSPALALIAQEKLLKHFLKRSVFDVRNSRNLELNYVVIHKKPATKDHLSVNNYNSVKPKAKTLVLMHGFGLGLGFFYGE